MVHSNLGYIYKVSDYKMNYNDNQHMKNANVIKKIYKLLMWLVIISK